MKQNKDDVSCQRRRREVQRIPRDRRGGENDKHLLRTCHKCDDVHQ